ncbi:glycosyltransferase family 4 protein [Algoriphagus lutimaris]|uniref:glycosyltransferase family 4 protein n=1 Tax=Algoriphagus lutimaris TaxID=613197 RepID=UPI00196B4315|nr:glycosyltransferase family 4 protein [Algoriphagus lutimaris]MBN3518826.1 glycosyltransferase family 4 protein [Algoriphagus lutimaris]
MKILIVGNGSTGINSATNEHFITKNTGVFLKSLANRFHLSFIQFRSPYKRDNDIVDYCITGSVRSLIFASKYQIIEYIKLFLLLIKMDYVYIFYPGSLGKLVCIFSIFLNKPFGLYIRGQYYNKNILDRFILNRSKFILTVSPSLSDDLSKFCSNVDVIKPMIDIDRSDFKLDRDYSIPIVWNFLFVGRVEERKGIFDLLEIAQNLKKSNIYFVLNIVGGGKLFDDFKSLLNKNNLQDYVILHGLVSDKNILKSIYDDADVFIFTSHDEGFPRVLYEAMASALPIFTTFVGGISGRMKHLYNCIEIPTNNSGIASDIIIQNLKRIKILKKIGKNGQKTLSNVISGTLLTHEELVFKNICS